jgi:hypothetical protein
MDSSVFFDARSAVMCGMLFSTIVAVTAEAPAAVPEVFQRMWYRYQIFQKTRRSKASTTSAEKFWEIDMTNFEP